MTYNVFGGTLSLAQSNPIHSSLHSCILDLRTAYIALKAAIN